MKNKIISAIVEMKKARFCEKICLKNKSYIENIMAEEENIIEKYIIFKNLLKK